MPFQVHYGGIRQPITVRSCWIKGGDLGLFDRILLLSKVLKIFRSILIKRRSIVFRAKLINQRRRVLTLRACMVKYL
jgi:hypothetical protein